MLKLSEREKQVIELVSDGFISKEIAARLKISDKTVQSYIARIYAKLGVRNRASAAVKYYKLYKPNSRKTKILEV